MLPAAVALTPHQGGVALSWFALALAGFVVWAHRANIKRLLRGEEHRFGGPPPRAGGSNGADDWVGGNAPDGHGQGRR